MRAAIIIAIVAALAIALSGGAASTQQAPVDDRLQLTIFVLDLCGGCGVDSPGCGNCQDIVKYHGIIKSQLGNRLYDGTIHYLMPNCRILANEDNYFAHFESYGVHAELYGYRPAIFIGDGATGIYLIGEQMLGYVGEYVDKFLACEDAEAIAALQIEIDELRALVYAE